MKEVIQKLIYFKQDGLRATIENTLPNMALGYFPSDVFVNMSAIDRSNEYCNYQQITEIIAFINSIDIKMLEKELVK